MDKATFAAVKIGDVVGLVTGPGTFPKDNWGMVVCKVENIWGSHVEAEFESGERHSIHNFTDKGIGFYRLPSAPGKWRPRPAPLFENFGKLLEADDVLRRLTAAIRDTERDHPLPRCEHGNALRDGGGEALEPLCGCRA